MEEKFNILTGVVVPPGKEFALDAFLKATEPILGKGFKVKNPGMPADQQRKIMVEEALKKNVSGILFLECDVIPPTNVMDLLKVKADIVGAAYLGWHNLGKPKIAPCAYALADKGLAFLPVDMLNKDTLLPVAAVGFGCAYVRMNALKTVSYPSGINDDIEFCRLALEKGMQVVVHGGVKCTRKTQDGELSWPMASAGFSFES